MHILTDFWKILNLGTLQKSGFFHEKFRKEAERGWKSCHFHERVDESPGRCENFGTSWSKKSLSVSEIQPFKDGPRVQISFPLHILGPVKLKISGINCNGAKPLWCIFVSFFRIFFAPSSYGNTWQRIFSRMRFSLCLSWLKHFQYKGRHRNKKTR